MWNLESAITNEEEASLTEIGLDVGTVMFVRSNTQDGVCESGLAQTDYLDVDVNIHMSTS